MYLSQSPLDFSSKRVSGLQIKLSIVFFFSLRTFLTAEKASGNSSFETLEFLSFAFFLRIFGENVKKMVGFSGVV